MQRSSSFCNSERTERTRQTTPPNTLSRIPTAPSARNANGATTPVTPMLRRSASLRLPSSRAAGSPVIEREVWGVGSGSWGKRQQMRRNQGLDKGKSPVTPPVSLRGLGSNSSIDMSSSRHYNLDDDDDLCSERSYDSTMSVDRFTSRSKRYVVHCNSGHSDVPSAANSTAYLTPTQRNALMNRELKAQLRQAQDDITSRDREISRLTQECVELRMSHVRRMGSASPAERLRSPTPPGIEKDSLNSSTHSESQVPSDKEISTSPKLNHQSIINKRKSIHILENLDENKESVNISLNSVISNNNNNDTIDYSHHNGCLSTSNEEDLSTVSPPPCNLDSPDQLDVQDGQLYQEVLDALKNQPLLSTSLAQPETKEMCTQTEDSSNEVTMLKDQLAVTHEALIETKGYQREDDSLLSAEEAVLLWRRASLQVQLSRARASAQACHGDVTLQFLKSAFFHLVTDNSQGATAATKSHWKAIQSILGFSPDECQAMDNALTTGTFPGGAWRRNPYFPRRSNSPF